MEALKARILRDGRNLGGGILKGGDSGSALVPGQPEQSRLVKAIRYASDELRMPPKGKLSDPQIADLVTWVKLGAPWPDRVHAVLAPPWSAYAKAAAAELCLLAAALPSRHPPPDSSAPRTAMADYLAAIETIRREGITRALPTDVLGRILGSAFRGEQLQRDLDDFVERTRTITTGITNRE